MFLDVFPISFGIRTGGWDKKKLRILLVRKSDHLSIDRSGSPGSYLPAADRNNRPCHLFILLRIRLYESELLRSDGEVDQSYEVPSGFGPSANAGHLPSKTFRCLIVSGEIVFRERFTEGRRRFQYRYASSGSWSCQDVRASESDTMHSLLIAIVDWAVKGTSPPPSQYPR